MSKQQKSLCKPDNQLGNAKTPPGKGTGSSKKGVANPGKLGTSVTVTKSDPSYGN